MKRTNLLLKLTAVAVFGALACGSAQAKVFKADTTVTVGGRMNVGDNSKASGIANRTFLMATHQVFADWGQVFFRGRLENPFGLKDTAWEGKDAPLNYQTFGDLYLNLGKSNFQFWLDESSFSNTAIHEMSLLAGVAYKMQFGKLNVKVGSGVAYAFGHVPYTPAYHGPGFIGTRVNFVYPINKKFLAFGMMDSRWDRDEQYTSTYGWIEDDGHHLILGGKYNYNQNVSLSVSYHNFMDFGGYDRDGQTYDVALTYKF
ncbi:hypothetical protein [Shewanella youngdeokensis]|uniref:Uncharacterized protein n=1 Tax=Shewanella youngdeokensis TaxID=2999068 RepID=A0ABZ0K311_9GAMM|nr:hypothetical protein RGE70_09030 [Shewanella sp. DAU334]